MILLRSVLHCRDGSNLMNQKNSVTINADTELGGLSR
jgi:hypothetical protein